jgi:Nif-specific regulatory protein
LTILEKPRTVTLAHVADEPRFLSRLGVYRPDLPFIAVPIKASGSPQGILGKTPRQIAYRIQTLNIEVKQF